MKAKSHRSSTQSRSMFQQRSKPTDCSFWAPCSRVCIPSSWQLFVWIKKKLILRRSGTSIEAALWSWVIYAVVSEEFVWRQCLGLEKSMATESSKNQGGLKSMLCFTGHRELLPVLTDILHWELERNRYIRKDQILDGAFQMHFPDAIEA